MKTFLIILIIFITLVCVIAYIVKRKISLFVQKYFGTSDLKKAIELSEIENQNTPKSLSGMENVSLPLVERDFPTLNINELKSRAESSIINYLNMLEKKEYSNIEYASENVKNYIISQINDLSETDNVKYDSINIHRTILQKYEKKDNIATLYFQTGLEYMCNKNGGKIKKVQDRFETEFIYIIDADKVNIKTKGIGLNCPNCGAPIKNIGNKCCDYCGSGVVDIVKRTWYLNNIRNN
ncbi:MAG TPA: hypothetical protein PLV83_05200 [Bacilli bacterium]|nr:hypothetical protein [Bacilli bacterium]